MGRCWGTDGEVLAAPFLVSLPHALCVLCSLLLILLAMLLIALILNHVIARSKLGYYLLALGE